MESTISPELIGNKNRTYRSSLSDVGCRLLLKQLDYDNDEVKTTVHADRRKRTWFNKTSTERPKRHDNSSAFLDLLRNTGDPPPAATKEEDYILNTPDFQEQVYYKGSVGPTTEQDAFMPPDVPLLTLLEDIPSPEIPPPEIPSDDIFGDVSSAEVMQAMYLDDSVDDNTDLISYSVDDDTDLISNDGSVSDPLEILPHEEDDVIVEYPVKPAAEKPDNTDIYKEKLKRWYKDTIGQGYSVTMAMMINFTRSQCPPLSDIDSLCEFIESQDNMVLLEDFVLPVKATKKKK